MRNTNLNSKRNQIVRTFICILLLAPVSYLSFGQISSNDIIPASTALARKDDFHKLFQGPGKVTTKAMRFKVDQLQEILNAYKAAGLSEISFETALIRKDDADKYGSKFSKLSASEKTQVANRQTLLIKVPQDGSASLKARFAVDRYYDVAEICPPPFGSCN